MPNEQNLGSDPDVPMIYQIRIKGHLSQQRMYWFDGLTIVLEDDGNTLISGPIVDQSALHGILKKIRDSGTPLLSVNSIDPNQTKNNKTDLLKGDL